MGKWSGTSIRVYLVLSLSFIEKETAINSPLRKAYVTTLLYQFYVVIVGIKINYHLLTSIYVTSILSYTVLEDDANDEK